MKKRFLTGLLRKRPAILDSWRHHDATHHHVCFRCKSSDKLITIALNNNGYITGFIFACGRCFLRAGRGAQLKWQIVEKSPPHYETDQPTN